VGSTEGVAAGQRIPADTGSTSSIIDRHPRDSSGMAYDENLAERIRVVLKDRPAVTERKMFGGLAFLVAGNMACGILGEDLMLRLGEDGRRRAGAPRGRWTSPAAP
jgi:hypothetical protein